MSSDFHGLLLIDKPSGITSHDVVAKLRKIMNTKAIGHSGTLDPLASGLMVCLINEGTKLSQYILEQNKSYLVGFRFGIETDTLDITGTITNKYQFQFNENLFKEKIQSLTGRFQWEVPIYSAIKVSGKKLYDYARNEQTVEIPKKEMNFWAVELVNLTSETAIVKMNCSKGSYIRTWVSQLGKSLNCGATMTDLRRLTNNPYEIEQAITLEELSDVVLDQKKQSDIGTPLSHPAMIPMSQALPNTLRIRVHLQDEKLLMNGQISHHLRGLLIQKINPELNQILQIISMETGKILSIIGLDLEKGFQIRRIFKY